MGVLLVLSFVVGSAAVCGVLLLAFVRHQRAQNMLATATHETPLEEQAVPAPPPNGALAPSIAEESAALTEPPTFPTLTAPPTVVAPPSAPPSEQSLVPPVVPNVPRPFKPIVQPWKTLPPPPPRARTSSRPSMSTVDPRAASLPNRLPPPGVAAKTLLPMSSPPAPDTVPSLPDDAPTEMMSALSAKDLESVPL